jgi:hypothetical protein
VGLQRLSQPIQFLSGQYGSDDRYLGRLRREFRLALRDWQALIQTVSEIKQLLVIEPVRSNYSNPFLLHGLWLHEFLLALGFCSPLDTQGG